MTDVVKYKSCTSMADVVRDKSCTSMADVVKYKPCTSMTVIVKYEINHVPVWLTLYSIIMYQMADVVHY